MKLRYLISIIIFIAIIAFFSIYSLFDKDNIFTEAENRELATMPKFSAQGYVDASFMGNFETYYNDQFPFRDKFISLSKLYNKLFFPNALISEDDVIELPPTNVSAGQPSGDNATAEEFTTGGMIYKNRMMEVFKYNSSVINRYSTIVNKLYEECGKPDTYVLIPTPAFTLYAPDEKLTEETDFYKAIAELKASLNGPKLVDLTKIFESKKDEYIYFKTDHHWNARGAYYACNEFLKAAENQSLKPLSSYKSGKRDNYLGSLYNSIKDQPASAILEKSPDFVEYFYPFAKATVKSYTGSAMTDPSERKLIYPEYEKSDLYHVYMGGDIPLGLIETETKNGKSILVVRDSYGHAFIPFLVDAYETIYLLEPRYFNTATAKFELGEFFIEHEVDTLLFLGYPNMSIGTYWYQIAKDYEALVNTP